MKYYLKINSSEFNVSELETTGLYRKENRQTNLVGGLLIDHAGSEKIKLRAKLNLLTAAQMAVLRAARAEVTCSVTFDRGSERLTKTMHIAEFTEPSPIYFFGDKNKGVRYGTLSIEMEEM